MNWNEHSKSLANAHAFLSPSSPHWVNYDSDKLRTRYDNHKKASLGTRLHAFAEECINLYIRLPRTAASLNSFVNDAIGFRMSPEVLLYYSDNAYGTADAVSFIDNHLRIFDLKTGTSPSKMLQLDVYCALFCLEYKEDPGYISFENRIYQNDEVLEWFPSSDEISNIMTIIIKHDITIEEMRNDTGAIGR